MNLVELKDVDFSYPLDDDGRKNSVLKSFNLTIEKGTFVAILGHNGSGKSTVAKLMNGLLSCDSGTVIVDGIEATDEDAVFEIRQRIGMVFQNPDNQIVSSIVEEDVAFGVENLGIDPKECRKRVDEALRTVDMYDYRLSSPGKLSGGQKQRVAVAGIIAMKPQCIILDESTAMLDPRGRQEVINTVLKLNEEHGITIVLITHHMDEAVKADRVVVIDDGIIRLDGTPQQVFKNIDVLKSLQLDVPQSTQLIDQLNLTQSDTILNPQQCADYLYELLED